jgi:hypothetical protein
MTRSQIIADCLEALNAAKGRVRQDDDGTTCDMIFDAAKAAKAQPDVFKRFRAALAKTEWSEMALHLDLV